MTSTHHLSSSSSPTTPPDAVNISNSSSSVINPTLYVSPSITTPTSQLSSPLPPSLQSPASQSYHYIIHQHTLPADHHVMDHSHTITSSPTHAHDDTKHLSPSSQRHLSPHKQQHSITLHHPQTHTQTHSRNVSNTTISHANLGAASTTNKRNTNSLNGIYPVNYSHRMTPKNQYMNDTMNQNGVDPSDVSSRSSHRQTASSNQIQMHTHQPHTSPDSPSHNQLTYSQNHTALPHNHTHTHQPTTPSTINHALPSNHTHTHHQRHGSNSMILVDSYKNTQPSSRARQHHPPPINTSVNHRGTVHTHTPSLTYSKVRNTQTQPATPTSYRPVYHHHPILDDIPSYRNHHPHGRTIYPVVLHDMQTHTHEIRSNSADHHHQHNMSVNHNNTQQNPIQVDLSSQMSRHHIHSNATTPHATTASPITPSDTPHQHPFNGCHVIHHMFHRFHMKHMNHDIHYPTFKADGEVESNYIYRKQMKRRYFVSSALLIFAVLYGMMEFVYIITPYYLLYNQTTTDVLHQQNWMSILIREVATLLVIIYALLLRYLAIFQHPQILECTTTLLMGYTAATLMVIEVFRTNGSLLTTTHDALLLSLTLIYVHTYVVLRIKFSYACIQAVTLLALYNIILLTTSTQTVRYTLLADAYQVLIMSGLLLICRDFEIYRMEDFQNKRHLFIERRKAEQLMRSMLPAQILGEYLDGRMAQLSANATIGYCEIQIATSKTHTRASTSTSNLTVAVQNTPADLMQKLHDTFKRIDSIVNMYSIRGVDKIETVSKTYLLCAGLLQDVDDHAAAMIEVALEIMNLIEHRSNVRSTHHQRTLPIQLRIGISTGHIVGGIIGEKRRYFRVFGDTVNVAARMCMNARAQQTQLSAATYHSMTDQQRNSIKAKFSAPIELPIKGKGNMICYTVESRGDFVAQFGKAIQFRGNVTEKLQDQPLLNKSFVYHRIIDHTTLHPFTLRFSTYLNYHMNDHQYPQQLNEDVHHQASPLTPHTVDQDHHHSKQSHHHMLVNNNSSTDVPLRADTNDGKLVSFDDHTSVTQSYSDHRHPDQQHHIATGATTNNATTPSSSSPSPCNPPTTLKPSPPNSPSTTTIKHPNPIELTFQHHYIHQSIQYLGKIYYVFLLWLIGYTIYAGIRYYQDLNTVRDISIPILFTCIVLIILSSTIMMHIHSLYEHMQKIITLNTGCICIWVICTLSIWGLHDAPMPPHFACLACIIYTCLLVRLQFMYSAPLTLTTGVAFLICMIIRMDDWYDILLVQLHIVICMFACLTTQSRNEYRVRINYLLRYALEQEQQHMNNFLYNLLPNFVVDVLQKRTQQQQLSSIRVSHQKKKKHISSKSTATSPSASSTLATTIPIVPSHDEYTSDNAHGLAHPSDQLSSRFAMKFTCCTVFESDIVGYTKMVSDWSPDKTLNMLNSMFCIFDDCASRCKVEKIETIGDAFMCVKFDGEPDPVLNFALTIVKELNDFNQRAIRCVENQHSHALVQVRMGISTGSCFGGVIGSKIPRFHLFGEAHDDAIKLEQNGKPGEASVSYATYAMTHERYEYQVVPPASQQPPINDKLYLLKSKKSCHTSSLQSNGSAVVDRKSMSYSHGDSAASVVTSNGVMLSNKPPLDTVLYGNQIAG